MAPEMKCDHKSGHLPVCAPLAVSFVPCQGEQPARYKKDAALIRGTVFPGLDLPLGNVVNNKTFDCPLANVMELDFAAHDLSLYLDTHPNDTEVFEAYQELLRMAKEAAGEYAGKNGPICKDDLMNCKSYRWLDSPWPWEKNGNPEV